MELANHGPNVIHRRRPDPEIERPPKEADDTCTWNGVIMYWLLVVAAVVAWMLVARRDAPEPVVAVRPPTHQPTLSEKWKGATGTQRAGLAAMAVGRVAWIGLVLMTLVAMTIGTATWMY